MKIWVLEMLFIVSVSCARFGKHVYVHRNYNWPTAQKHCRIHYTDLSPITTWWEERRLRNVTYGVAKKFWIGLYKNSTQWMWSGGGRATYSRWDAGEENDHISHIYGSVCWHGCGWSGWHSEGNWNYWPFLCFNLIVIESNKTWEQAVEYCRQKHTTLTSLSSETEHLLALREIQHDHITEQVWIGLRYVEGWMWVDGYPLWYQAWNQGDHDQQCPIWKRCGALTKAGKWESVDCEERLNFICY